MLPKSGNQFHPASAAFILISGLVWITLSASPSSAGDRIEEIAPQIGFVAPDFTLENLNGEAITLSSLAGQPVLVNLWASWCGPCRAEMPAIQRAFEQFEPDGAVVLAVNLTAQDSREAAATFAAEHGLTFQILLDIDGEVARLYQNRALPSSYFIGPDGVIREIVIGGPMAEALIATRFEALLTGGR
jgi:peroxiredoxin